MKYKFEDIIFNITEKKKPVEEDKYNYIGLEHLESGNLFISKWGSDTAPEGEKIVMKKGDVLFGKRRAYQKKVAISPIDGIFSAHGMVLRPKEDVICKEFLPFFISSEAFLNEAIRISVGGLSPTVNWKDIRELEFDLPPLAEQKVLAEKLWAAYEVKLSYLKMIAATEEMVKAQFIEMFGDPITNPKQYAIYNVAEISKTLFAGGDKPKDIMDVPNGEYKYPVWANGEGDRGLLGYSKTYRVDEESISISARGSIGYCAIRTPYYTPVVRLIVLVPKNNVNITYLKFFFEAIGFEKTGAVQGQLTIPDLKKKNVILPPFEEQSKFASIVNQADNLISELRKSVDAIDKVIKSLINENL